MATPRALRSRDDAEEALDLGLAERRGGLVHDEHAHVVRQRLGDLDDLLLADAQVADQLVGVDVLAQPLHQLERQLPLGAAVDGRPTGDLLGQEEVVQHRQVGAEVELLEDDADAVLGCVGDAGQHDGLAVHEDAPVGGLLDPREDLHQRRLAGTVLADEHVDLALEDIEGHVVERGRAREDLGDVLGAHGHAQRHRGRAGGGRRHRHRSVTSMGTSSISLTSMVGWLKVRSVKAPVKSMALPSEVLLVEVLEVGHDLLVDLLGDLAVLGLLAEVAELDEAGGIADRRLVAGDARADPGADLDGAVVAVDVDADAALAGLDVDIGDRAAAGDAVDVCFAGGDEPERLGDRRQLLGGDLAVGVRARSR